MTLTFRFGVVLGLLASILFILGFFSGALADRLFVVKPIDYIAQRLQPENQTTVAPGNLPALGDAANTVANVAEQASLSVVTVAIKRQQPVFDSPRSFSPFPGFFGFNFQQPVPDRYEEVEQDIGTGFVVDGGLVITNKHVVASDDETYLVIDKENKEYEVQRIYRDPLNDLAILKIEASLPALPLGDSSQLRVGEGVIAIGTALGEFRHTVTTGVISGLGRGITAGFGFGSAAESLENVIQTDAAINPGNSGGPLINLRGEVVGVNVAVSQSAQNIGFALPINTIKDSLRNFEETGSFDRPFLGVRYQMITQQAALVNEVPQGAYIVEVTSGSPAERAGIQAGDIVTSFGGKKMSDDVDLAQEIATKKLGEEVEVELYRTKEEKTLMLRVTIAASQN